MNKLEAAKRLQNRTKHFAMNITKTFAGLPKTEAARVIGWQFLRSGTAVAANFARRAVPGRWQISFQKSRSSWKKLMRLSSEANFWWSPISLRPNRWHRSAVTAVNL